jgi:hypothetical protein
MSNSKLKGSNYIELFDSYMDTYSANERFTREELIDTGIALLISQQPKFNTVDAFMKCYKYSFERYDMLTMTNNFLLSPAAISNEAHIDSQVYYRLYGDGSVNEGQILIGARKISNIHQSIHIYITWADFLSLYLGVDSALVAMLISIYGDTLNYASIKSILEAVQMQKMCYSSVETYNIGSII